MAAEWNRGKDANQTSEIGRNEKRDTVKAMQPSSLPMHFLNGRDDVSEQNINHYRRRSSWVFMGVLITSLADNFLPKRGSFGRQKKNHVLLPGLRTNTFDFPNDLPLFSSFALKILLFFVLLHLIVR